MSDGLIVMDDTLLKRTKMNEDTYDACGQLNYDTGIPFRTESHWILESVSEIWAGIPERENDVSWWHGPMSDPPTLRDTDTYTVRGDMWGSAPSQGRVTRLSRVKVNTADQGWAPPDK